MVPSERTPMSDAERDILKLLWDQGPKTAREVMDLMSQSGQDWSRSTVITLLQRLEKKQYVTSDQSQHAFVFRASVSREEVMHARMLDVAGELCDGDALPLVLAFAQKHRFSTEDIARFRKMIDGLETRKGKRGSR